MALPGRRPLVFFSIERTHLSFDQFAEVTV
jgi:hypothetical protein